MTKTTYSKSDDNKKRIETATRQFYMYLGLAGMVILGILALIAWAVYLKYDLELKKLDQEKTRTIRLSQPNPSNSRANFLSESSAQDQEEALSRNKSLEIIERFVTTESQEQEKQGRNASVPWSAVASMIDALKSTVDLTADAGEALNEVKNQIIAAGIDVTVDTIKKITARLIEKKQDENPNKKIKDVNRENEHLTINLACNAERPRVITIAPKPPKPPQPPAAKLECPVPLVPVMPG